MLEPTDTPLVRVMALHALAYCERLFYLEEVEELRIADARVYAGRRLHAELEEEGTWETLTLSSEALGIKGKVDCLRRRDGAWIPYEHKRGRSRSGPSGPEAWDSDRLQALAYGHLVGECLGVTVAEVRIRYHVDNRLIRLNLSADTRKEVLSAVDRAHILREQLERPPVTSEANRCTHCSLAPLCLPEEERLLDDPDRPAHRLFPPHRDRQVIHVTGHGSKLGKSADELVVKPRRGSTDDPIRVPIRTVEQVVLHGHAQISTQALYACQRHGVGVHWVTSGGRYMGGLRPASPQVQRRHRQYAALTDDDLVHALVRRLVEARIQSQLRFILRTSRGEPRSEELESSLQGIRLALSHLDGSDSVDQLRGYEGAAARHYIKALSGLLNARLSSPFHMSGRSRRPPRDRVNCLLSFGYALLYRDCVAACFAAGLEPALGLFHRPRSAAYPLSLDLQELFRVALVDMPTVAALSRRQFDPDDDFTVAADHVWLSDSGRRKAIAIYERRKQDTWKHPVVGYSLSYDRLIELEARLLEKEWTGKPGLFARMRLR